MYKDLLEKLRTRAGIRIQPTVYSSLSQSQMLYPEIPEDYWTFLREIGWGNLGVMMLYSGPTEPDNFNSQYTGKLPGLILIGDDFQGFSYYFDRDDRCKIVEANWRLEIEVVSDTFESFIRDELSALWDLPLD